MLKDGRVYYRTRTLFADNIVGGTMVKADYFVA